MTKCKNCGAEGPDDKFELWEDGVPLPSCFKCNSDQLEVVPDPDPLASWYKGTAVVLLERPSNEEKKDENSNNGQQEVDERREDRTHPTGTE